MSEPTLWFPADVKPVRKGWYECRYCIERGNADKRHYWHGSQWTVRKNDAWPMHAFVWRGLSRPSNDPRSEGK